MREKLTKREIELIRILSEHNGYVETALLCEKMNIKPRTLRECIRLFREMYADEAGVDIKAGTGLGYRLVILDEQKYYTLLKELMEAENNARFIMPSDQDDRVNYLIRTLLTANDYIRPEELADRLYISRSTYAEDMKLVKEQLSVFGLQVETVPKQGVHIIGDEFHIRNAIAEYCFENAGFDAQKLEDNLTHYFGDHEYGAVRSVLYETLKKYEYTIADANFRNLIVHILIAMNRIQDGTYIQQPPSAQTESLKKKKEWQIAKDLYQQLSAKTGLEIPESEIGYVVIHLLGKKMIASESEMVLYPETLNMMTSLLKEINDRYGYDFSSDLELFSALSMHMQPLIERAKYGLHISNPMLNDINRENPLAFDIAAMTGQFVENQTGLTIDENEIGYMALHFALAIERKKTGIRKRVLVVCASGAGTSKLLAYRIRKKFAQSCQSVDTMSYFDLQAAGTCDYDLVLSTVPIYFELNVPVIRIREIPDADDLNRIDQALHADPEEFAFVCGCFDRSLFFPDASLKTPEEIIAFLTNKLKETIHIDEGFEQAVISRETLSSTAMGNLCAFPHCAKGMADITKVAVLSLKKPVDWYGSQVQLVFLTVMQKKADRSFAAFSETLAALFTERKLLNRLMQQTDYDQLISCLKEIYQKPKEDIFQ